MSDILFIFLEEAGDTLEQWREEVETLRQTGQCDFGALFRCAHNLKGSSRSVGLQEYGAFLHVVENLITRLRDNLQPVTPEAIELLEASRGTLAAWGSLLRTDEAAVVDASALLQALNSICEGQGEAPPSSEESAEAQAEDDGIFWAVPPPAQSPVKPTAEAVPQAASPAPAPVPAPLQNPRPSAASGRASEESVRVPRRRIDELARSVSELTLAIDALQAAQVTPQDLVDLKQRARDLQSLSLDLVVAPAAPLLEWLGGIAKDVGARTGKEFEVVLEGLDTSIDKRILERMKDPLMHVVRNAVDHGLETPADRVAAGKTHKGTLTIRATRSATTALIEVSDNGRGMDPERLRRKAEEKGLIAPNSNLSKKECIELIFLPGFSTAGTISDISGRGVGMDVVRQAVVSLQGEVSIDSVLGAGSTFKMIFSSDVSIVPTLLVEAGESRMGIPTEQVEEVVLNSEAEITTRSGGERLLKQNNIFFPLYRLAELLQNEPLHASEQSLCLAENAAQDLDQGCIIVTRVGEARFGIQIDRVLNERSLVVRRAVARYQRTPGIQGIAIFEEGLPGPLLDLVDLLKCFERHTSASARTLNVDGRRAV